MFFITPSHFFTLFNQKNLPKNRYYTRKQRTHFSMALLRPKLEKKNQNHKILKCGMAENIDA